MAENLPNGGSPKILAAVEAIVENAPKKDVGIFLRMVGVALFVIAMGIAVSFVLRGWVSADFSQTATINSGTSATTADAQPENAVRVSQNLLVPSGSVSGGGPLRLTKEVVVSSGEAGSTKE